MQLSTLFVQEQSAGARGRLADVGVIWDTRLLPRPTQQRLGVLSLSRGFEQMPGKAQDTHTKEHTSSLTGTGPEVLSLAIEVCVCFL